MTSRSSSRSRRPSVKAKEASACEERWHSSVEWRMSELSTRGAPFGEYLKVLDEFDLLPGPSKALREAFSSCDSKEVMARFALSNGVPRYTPQLLHLPKSFIQRAMEEFDENRMLRITFKGKNEATRLQWFESCVRKIIANFLGVITIQDEEPLESPTVGGRVELVHRLLSLVLLVIVEAKQDHSHQGLAQLILELYVSTKMNRAYLPQAHSMVGILTTMERTTFVKYDKQKPFPLTNKPLSAKVAVAESQAFDVHGPEDHAGLEALLKQLASVFIIEMLRVSSELLPVLRDVVLVDTPNPSDDEAEEPSLKVQASHGAKEKKEAPPSTQGSDDEDERKRKEALVQQLTRAIDRCPTVEAALLAATNDQEAEAALKGLAEWCTMLPDWSSFEALSVKMRLLKDRA